MTRGGRRPGAGRPRTVGAVCTLHIRAGADVLDALAAIMDATGVGQSEAARTSIIAAAPRKPIAADGPPTTCRECGKPLEST